MADIEVGNIAAFPRSTLMMMEPRALESFTTLMGRLIRGAEHMPKRSAEPSTSTRSQAKSIAVIPIIGVMENRATMFSDWYGGIGTDRIGAAFDAAVMDDRVKSILMLWDTPGGMVYGTPELAKKIYDARGVKPIVSLAEHMAASAGYYAASAAHRLYVSPSADVGSVGVYQMHVDYSNAMEAEGVKVTFIKAGAHKVEGNPYEPLSQDALDYIQGDVNDIYDQFVADVAKHRSVSKADVLANFGEGRTLNAKRAVAAGMADGIATFDQVVARLHAGKINTAGAAANDDWESPVVMEDSESFGTAEWAERKLSLRMRG